MLNLKEIEGIVRNFIDRIGEDPDRQGLQKTPDRVARAWDVFTSGYRVDMAKLLNEAIFDEPCDEMVVVRDIELYSMCEHHLLPFFGRCHIAYTPRDKVIGLSKLARLVDVFARRLQIQERLTTQIAACLQDCLNPRGVGVVIEAQHLCMMMRGVEKQNSFAVTSALLGDFKTDPKSRGEFLDLIHSRKGL